jgi:hypothetical protein
MRTSAYRILCVLLTIHQLGLLNANCAREITEMIFEESFGNSNFGKIAIAYRRHILKYFGTEEAGAKNELNGLIENDRKQVLSAYQIRMAEVNKRLGAEKKNVSYGYNIKLMEEHPRNEGESLTDYFCRLAGFYEPGELRRARGGNGLNDILQNYLYITAERYNTEGKAILLAEMRAKFPDRFDDLLSELSNNQTFELKSRVEKSAAELKIATQELAREKEEAAKLRSALGDANSTVKAKQQKVENLERELKDKWSTGAIVLTAIIAGGIGGGGVYMLTKSSQNDELEKLRKSMESLEEQMKQLNQKPGVP